MDRETQALISDLYARINKLEQQDAGESLTPNYLTYNPATGLIGGVFSGGISIPEVLVASQASFNTSVNFIPADAGGGINGISGLLAEVFTGGLNQHTVILVSQADSTDFAQIALATSEAGAGTNQVKASAQNGVLTAAVKLIDASGVSDLFQVSKNLSEGNAGTIRTNLGLGTAAQQAIAFFVQVANNLSDLANIATARANLGFGTANPLRMSSVGGISLSFSASVTGSVVVNHGLKDANGNNLAPTACYPSLAFGTPSVVTGITYDPASITSTQVTVYGVRPAAATITLPITVLSVA